MESINYCGQDEYGCEECGDRQVCDHWLTHNTIYDEKNDDFEKAMPEFCRELRFNN